jgi:hypothetical protein
MKGSKVDWHGYPDGTPPSSPERNPLDQPDHKPSGGKYGWRGMEDGKPSSSSDRDKAIEGGGK